MCNQVYSTNLESLFSASVDNIVKVLEQTDTVYNSQTIKDLVHRKGLNLRFLWAILAKLRQHFMRDQVMIEILLRVVRKLVNEETKNKCRMQVTSTDEQGNLVVQEYFQENQFENYKDTVTQLMNSLLKRKVQKNKQVFDEILLGLFLQRMSIFNFIHHLNLRKEEYFYLESKDILEDIVDAPSRNPVLFINAVQTYFRIEFKVEVLRLSRQDKLLYLSKGQPIQKGEIRNLMFRVHSYNSIREQAYFILARSITNSQHKNSPILKLISKVKTKTEKDKLKQSFQRPREADNLNSSSISSRQRGIGPQSISQINESIVDNQDQKTNRQKIPIVGNNKESLNTIRQYHNMDKAIINDSAEFGSPPLNQSKLTKLNTQSDQIIDFSRVSKRSQFQPTQMAELIIPPVLYRLKTYLSQNPMTYFEDQSKIFLGETLTVLQPFYEVPSIELVEEWVMILESTLKEVFAVHGEEQVLLEALIYQALLIYFYKEDFEEMLKVLQKIRDLLFLSAYCAPETLIMIQILTGMFFEEQKDQHPMEAEKSYLTATICLLQLYGDPRGRGNIGIPINLFLSWKLSLLSLAEDKKLHDSEVAEEVFDATLRCLFNHKKLYNAQQIQQLMNQKNQNQNFQAQLAELLKPTQFDIEVEKQEMQKLLFDMRRFKNKTQLVNYASVPKSNSILRQKRQDISIASQINKDANQKESIKSKSQVPAISKRKGQQNEYDIEVSDIELEVEDESQNAFSSENFKPSQISIGVCPFQHWSLYRWQIAQILLAHNSVMSKNASAQTQYQRQIYREMLCKSVSKDLLYQWLVKFNPIQYSCGLQWNSELIRNVIFSQNQQMVSSSGSSVVMSSQHNLSSSHHSMTSSTPSSAKEKRHLRLGSYTQILGKEVGAISKQELSGVIFSFGTDNSGQLGLDLIALESQHSTASLKVLYPRMIVSLRDEIIKEVCCGHSHTLVTNVQGQVFVWGNNEFGQLGLGENAPKFIRKPILNSFIQNVQKLSAGHEHSLALTKNGELYMWGSGGLSGQGTLNQQNKPAKVDFFSKTKISYAVCGGLHTLVVTKDGEAYSWGSTEGGQLGLPQTQIQALCQGEEIPVSTPQRIPGLQGMFITQVACGEAHSIAMTREGNLYGWGQSNYGQLGLGFSSDSFEPGVGMSKSKVPEPQEITGLKHERVSRIFCGATFSLFLTDKGDLYGCGVNDLGQLGLDTFMEEMQIASLEKAKRGKHHQTSDVTLPTKVICFQGIALHNIACGENHSLAVSGDGMNMLWAWGMYKNGQLGLGEVTMKMNPRPVQTLCSSLIQKIACGGMHSMALIGDSSLVSTYSSQYYSSNEQITSHWLCNIRPLALRNADYYDDLQDYDVPDDGEGRVKNPK